MLLNTFRKFKFYYFRGVNNYQIRQNVFYIRRGKSTRNKYSHILIVSNPVYVDISMVCIASFMSANPEYLVVIHCDVKTFPYMQQAIKKLGLADFVIINCDMSKDLSWQQNKVELILSLNGSSDLFMDADLRWNGKLPDVKGITFFVKEFLFQDKSPYRQILEVVGIDPSPQASMKNTSFFTFAGKFIEPNLVREVREEINSFSFKVKSCNIGILDLPILERLSEQIVISILAEKWDDKINFLKESDGHKDGAFVESSYFGATGSTF